MYAGATENLQLQLLSPQVRKRQRRGRAIAFFFFFCFFFFFNSFILLAIGGSPFGLFFGSVKASNCAKRNPTLLKRQLEKLKSRSFFFFNQFLHILNLRSRHRQSSCLNPSAANACWSSGKSQDRIPEEMSGKKRKEKSRKHVLQPPLARV